MRARIAISILATIIGFALPIALYVYTGEVKNSISSYYYSSAKIGLVLSLLIVALGFFINKIFWLSGIALTVVAVLGCRDYHNIHNAAALVFFLNTAVQIIKEGKLKHLGYGMFIGALLLPVSILVSEIVMIYLIALYNLVTLMKKRGILRPLLLKTKLNKQIINS